MKDVVIFHLKRIWEGKDLWEEIKSGRKTSEWRDFCEYWLYRLCKPRNPNILILYINVNGTAPQELSPWLKVKKAWFLQGYPKANLPRLEAEITGLVYHPSSSQLETKFTNVTEITEEKIIKRQKMSKIPKEIGRIYDQHRARLSTFLFTVPLPRMMGTSHFMDDYFIRRKQYVDEAVEQLRQKETTRQ